MTITIDEVSFLELILLKAIGGGSDHFFWSKNIFSLSKTRVLYSSDAFYRMEKENCGPKLWTIKVRAISAKKAFYKAIIIEIFTDFKAFFLSFSPISIVKMIDFMVFSLVIHVSTKIQMFLAKKLIMRIIWARYSAILYENLLNYAIILQNRCFWATT